MPIGTSPYFLMNFSSSVDGQYKKEKNKLNKKLSTMIIFVPFGKY